MHIRFAHVAALASSLLLAACATAPYKPLPAGARDKLTATDVAMPIRQNEIYVYVPPSNVGGSAGAAFGLVGGIVGAIVDVSVNQARTANAETAVKPLRVAMVGFEADTALRDDVKASLGKLEWLHATDVKVVKDFGVDVTDGILNATTSAAVLYATVDYQLDNDGNVLQVSMQTSLFTKAGAKPFKPGSLVNTKLENAIYRDVFIYKTKMDGVVDKIAGAKDRRDATIALWSADSGAALRAALKAASVKLAAILADDLARTGTEPLGKEVEIDGIRGQVVSTDDEGTLIRIKDGGLQFATKAFVVRAVK